MIEHIDDNKIFIKDGEMNPKSLSMTLTDEFHSTYVMGLLLIRDCENEIAFNKDQVEDVIKVMEYYRDNGFLPLSEDDCKCKEDPLHCKK